MVYEFAIKKDLLNNGREILTPVVRVKSRFFPGRWDRITKIYGRYLLMELDFVPDLTREECQEHIVGYKAVLEKLEENEIKDIVYDTLEQKEY